LENRGKDITVRGQEIEGGLGIETRIEPRKTIAR
jgi:hypothetical protein